jgi:hypothetical protein
MVIALLAGCGSSASHSATGSTSGSGSGNVQITYDGQIGQGRAPGHASFVATEAITDTGTLVINGRQRGAIVYTKLRFTGKKGTFRAREKIIIGGVHTWRISSGTGAYSGLHGTGTEGGRPDSGGHIHVLMTGTVKR